MSPKFGGSDGGGGGGAAAAADSFLLHSSPLALTKKLSEQLEL